MGTKSKTENLLDQYCFERKAGKCIVDRCPLFSPDGESLAIIVENIVCVYNVETGECTRTLETENAVTELVAIQFPENEQYNLYGCSDNGQVTIWTWDKGAVLRETILNITHGQKILTFHLLDNNECFVMTHKPRGQYISLATYSLISGEMRQTYPSKPIYSDLVRVSLGWCNGDRFAAITNLTKFLYIQNLFEPYICEKFMTTSDFCLCAVAAHPTDSAVAVNNTLGQTTVIRGNLFDRRCVSKEVLHWHYLPPFAVCFSVLGNYLYTGGIEEVLVKWPIAHVAGRADEKMFIPRLPGTIRYVTTSNDHIAIALSNNSVVVASTAMRVVATVLECGGLPAAARAAGSALLHLRRLGALLLAGPVGHLQLYSTESQKVLYNIDITEMNRVGATRRNLTPTNTEVACAAVSGDGVWLATSEYFNNGTTRPEERLKFWRLRVKGQVPVTLNTVVDLSHNGYEVFRLVLDYDGNYCVSAGRDHMFRLWERTRDGGKSEWSGLADFYYSTGLTRYLRYKLMSEPEPPDASSNEIKEEDLPYLKEPDAANAVLKKIFNGHKEKTTFARTEKRKSARTKEPSSEHYERLGDVAISRCGMRVAAWYGRKLTLWDTEERYLKATLTHPLLDTRGVHVTFGNANAIHYVVCTTETMLGGFNIFKNAWEFFVPLRVTCLAADPFSNKMVVVTQENDVHIFNPREPGRKLSRRALLPPAAGAITHCTFGTPPADRAMSRVYFTRNDGEIYCLEPKQAERGRLEAVAGGGEADTRFGALLAERRVLEPRRAAGGRGGPGEGQGGDEHDLSRDKKLSAIFDKYFGPSGGPHHITASFCFAYLLELAQLDPPERPEQTPPAAPEPTPAAADSGGDSSADDSDDGAGAPRPPSDKPKIPRLYQPDYSRLDEAALAALTLEQTVTLHMARRLLRREPKPPGGE